MRKSTILSEVGYGVFVDIPRVLRRSLHHCLHEDGRPTGKHGNPNQGDRRLCRRPSGEHARGDAMAKRNIHSLVGTVRLQRSANGIALTWILHLFLS